MQSKPTCMNGILLLSNMVNTTEWSFIPKIWPVKNWTRWRVYILNTLFPCGWLNLSDLNYSWMYHNLKILKRKTRARRKSTKTHSHLNHFISLSIRSCWVIDSEELGSPNNLASAKRYMNPPSISMFAISMAISISFKTPLIIIDLLGFSYPHIFDSNWMSIHFYC